jgi:hypothetical protein
MGIGKETPLNPHVSPHVLTRLIKESNADDTCCTYFIVLGGPISGRIAGHRVLRHLETVRHDIFTHTHPFIPHAHACSPPSLPFLCFEERAWIADAKKRCI